MSDFNKDEYFGNEGHRSDTGNQENGKESSQNEIYNQDETVFFNGSEDVNMEYNHGENAEQNTYSSCEGNDKESHSSYQEGSDTYSFYGTSFGETPKKEKKKREYKVLKKVRNMVAYGLVFGMVSGVAFTGVSYGLSSLGFSAKSAQTVESTKTVSTTSKSDSDLSEVAKNVLPSIVSITGKFQTSSYGFFGQTTTQESEGSGSGIIVKKDKKYIYIATNNHVVEDAISLAVGFCDGSTVEANIKGTESDSDLAVVTVPISKMTSKTLNAIKIVTMGNSEDLIVGERAIAIGNALGYGQSVTGGYISALNRKVQLTDKTMTLIQTDAAINPGNSGGALLDGTGKLVGINTVKYSSESVEGMGYAIPINTAKPIIEKLIKQKDTTSTGDAYMGVYGKDVSSDMSQAYNIPEGIYISEVVENSPANKAGIQAGDVIVSFDGNEAKTMQSLQNQLQKKAVGSKVKIKVKRQTQMGGYEDVTLTVTLGKKTEDASTQNSSSTTESAQSDSDSNIFGN